jgi:hypothetical protein
MLSAAGRTCGIGHIHVVFVRYNAQLAAPLLRNGQLTSVADLGCKTWYQDGRALSAGIALGRGITTSSALRLRRGPIAHSFS